MRTDIRPFHIAVPQADLDDLRARLGRTRWSAPLPGAGWDRGVPVAYLRELAEYWRTEFDWRAQEAALNEFPQYLTEIEGLEVHFVHVRSARPDALPLILTHGWPNSFVEFSKTIGLLAENFHVIVPSVPGFAFSAPPRELGMTPRRVAEMWLELMTRLGYHRFGAQGGDLGAYVTTELAIAAPERVIGVHIDGGIGMPTAADVPTMDAEERAEWDLMQQWMTGVNHHEILHRAPQTFAHGWTDSPAGLLGWLMQKFHEFTPLVDHVEEAIDRDHLLTNISLYWFTAATGDTSWPMYNGLGPNGEFVWPTGQKRVPTGVYSGGSALMRRLAERDNAIAHWPTGNTGNHFVAMEVPQMHVADINAFFGMLR